MYEIGLSTNGKELTEELFEAYQNAGIKHMELSLTFNYEEEAVDYSFVRDMSKKYGINLWSKHLPFGPIDEIDISNPKIAKQTFNYFSELIKRISDIGVNKFVVHPSGEPIEDAERSERLECAKHNLAELAGLAKRCGSVVAVEDLPRTCLGNTSSEIKELISLNDDLMVCFDTNHLLIEDNVDFIKNIGDRIITTHISDYDFINERHWLPGEGKIDWQSLKEALKTANYNGPWLYEVGFKCPKTIIRERDLNCFDFAKNADEILNDKSITIFSQNKPNLGMWE